MVTFSRKRPRNVNALQAAAFLYGDWGTSKAYVIGLAFAIAGYSSFWLILAVSILIAFVGFNYITICKSSPFGGGVYASARKKSETLSLISAFFLIGDYLITAALSALSSFHYLTVIHPFYWAIAAILMLGLVNFFGPKHSGNLALVIGLCTFIVVILLTVVALPFLPNAIHNLQLPKSSFVRNWIDFTGVIVALSGIESIANITGVMKLDRGSTYEHPSIHQTSKKAILMTMAEVCFFTTIFGLLINAIPNLEIINHKVYGPGTSTDIRDDMLRYMANFFVSQYEITPFLSIIFSSTVSIVFAFLLLSAVNTAIVALISLLFVISRDGELPLFFQKVNRFGVPVYALLATVIAPIGVLIFVHDIAALADLYAIGFVGAIATNLGVNGFDETLPMGKKERSFMLTAFVIMVAIEITLFITKPHARHFALTLLCIGLILRALVVERRTQQWATKKVNLKHASLFTGDTTLSLHEGALLCAIRTIGKTLYFALEEAKRYQQPLYILFVREQNIITEVDKHRTWLEDPQACEIFDYAKESSHEISLKFLYAVSDSPADTIAHAAQDLHVSRVIIGRSRQNFMLQVLRGNIVKELSDVLPSEIDLLVIS